MGFERPETPEEEEREAEAFLKTLGPVMLVNGYTSIVTLARDAEDQTYRPAILLRFEGRANEGIEMVTSSMLLSPGDTEHLVQMLAEQAVMAQNWNPPAPE